jgi:hypothetical protein
VRVQEREPREARAGAPGATSGPFRVGAVLAQVAAGSWPDAPPVAFTDALRHEVEDALAPSVATIPAAALPLRAPKRRLADVLACERAALASIGSVPPVHVTAAGQLVDRLVQGHVLGFGTGAGDPLGFARDAVVAEGDDELLEWLDALDAAGSEALRERLQRAADALDAGWGAIDGRWWPRCEQPLTVPLLGGRVLASGRLDVALGGPRTGRRGAIIEIKSGTAAALHQRADLHWYALLAAWAWGEAPALVATWSAEDDACSVEPVGEGMLEAAARRAVHALERLARLAAGEAPATRPSARCGWCPVLAHCPPGVDGLRRARAEAAEPWGTPEADDGW